MNRRAILVWSSFLILSLMSAASISFATGELVDFQDVQIATPGGWKLVQEAKSDNTLFLVFSQAYSQVALYVKPTKGFDFKSFLASNAQFAAEYIESHGPFHWNLVDVTYAPPSRATVYLSAFSVDYKGNTYFGYSRAASKELASKNAIEFLDAVFVRVSRTESTRSLTGADYSGKKYYLGWGAAHFGDQQSMQNEVKYDVLHTHDIFTKEIGGNYIGKTFIGSDTSASEIRDEWDRLKGLIKTDDMFVQYSSGHGSKSGLGVGVSYKDIRDNALSYDAKEIIIFTMACYSGNLVNSFNQKKSVWENWQSNGRTLFVMASSKPGEESQTGPGTDPEEAGGPDGSAGSAFGHALWKALIGHADGYVDGVKDGFLSLEEIREFTIATTLKVGHHTPQVTGAYNGGLVMNKVPSREFLESLKGSTEGLTDAEIMEKIRELDAALRL